MSEPNHPEFQEEVVVLDGFIEDLTRDAERLMSTDLGGGNSNANIAIMKHLTDMQDLYDDALNSYPYFGRIDFEQDGKLKRLYVGRSFFEGTDYVIVSHHASIANLFYDPSEETTIKGKPVRLLLSRQLNIHQRSLAAMFDRVDRRQQGTGIVASSAAQDYLLRQLAIKGAAGLRDIAETMQREQRAIIRAPAGASLIINGVPGSGKTTIAYHRLSYLLSRDNELDLGLDPQRMLFLGPSAYFASYASTLLPSLELGAIRHTTFDELALGAMPKSGTGTATTKNRYRVVDTKQGKRKPSAAAIRKAAERRAIKASRYFAAALEQLARTPVALKQLPSPVEVASDGQPTIELDQGDFDVAYAAAIRKRAAAANQRRTMVDELLRLAHERLLALGADAAPTNPDPAWRKALQGAVKRVWPPATARDIYYDWLRDPSTVATTLAGRSTPDGAAALLTGSPKAPSGAIHREDLAAIFHLHLLRRQAPAAAFDHVMLDEGQDLDTMQLAAVKLLSRNGVFTVLGDVAQRIRPTGSAGWTDVATTLGVAPENVLNITQSYRSTEEIVAFSNRLLAAVAPDAVPARAFPRPGERPRVHAAASDEAMADAIASEVGRLQTAFDHVAVLTHSSAAATTLAAALRARDVPVTLPTDRDAPEGKRISVLGVELAKGVEYDAVVVADASANAYPAAPGTNGHLLYVAATRPMHYLSVHFVGEPSPYLAPFYEEYLVPQLADA